MYFLLMISHLTYQKKQKQNKKNATNYMKEWQIEDKIVPTESNVINTNTMTGTMRIH